MLGRLADQGNTVVVIEHNLDVIKTADWIIDMGPDGGNRGGQVVVEGTPEQVAQHPTSHTAAFLAGVLAGTDIPVGELTLLDGLTEAPVVAAKKPTARRERPRRPATKVAATKKAATAKAATKKAATAKAATRKAATKKAVTTEVAATSASATKTSAPGSAARRSAAATEVAPAKRAVRSVPAKATTQARRAS